MRIFPEQTTVKKYKENENNSQITPGVFRNNNTYEPLGGILIQISDVARSSHFNNIANLLFIDTDKLYHCERLQDAVKLAEKLIGDISPGYRAMTCLVYSGNRVTVSLLKLAGMEIIYYQGQVSEISR